MNMYVSIYTDKTPLLIRQLADTPEMKRLSGIGMHCGCEYTRDPFYRKARGAYSRYIHSIGAANIIWNFTNDIRQAAAGLFHDIATPCFAHTVDFLNNDRLTQESTESKTRLFIEKSDCIMKLLDACDIITDEIEDYHKYPIADNDTPMLSADRLEYTLGNGYLVQNLELTSIRAIYEDLIITSNESGTEELCFRSLEAARAFTEISLINSRRFSSDSNRFSMQYLADMLRSAIEKGVISSDVLYSEESQVIQKLKNSSETSALWDCYTKISSVASSEQRLHNRYCVNIPAKKRYINPLVYTRETPKRIMDIDTGIRTEIEDFLAVDFDRWLYAVL